VREEILYESFKQGWLTRGFDSQQAVVITLPKASKYVGKLQHLKSEISITPQSPLRRTDLTNKTNHA
jgi:hypothetical protein